MYAFLMVLFIFVTLFLALFVLVQQGKGDLGLNALGGSTQMLFGGSGGKSFFEKVTWVLGAVFIFGALGLSVMKSKALRSSRLSGYVAQKNKATEQAEQPKQQAVATEDKEAETAE